MKSKAYNKSFYELESAGSLMSAREVIPVVMQFIIPQSVIDIGCGTGTWLAEWAKKGVKDISGIDGGYINESQLIIHKDNFISRDLEKELNIQRQYDLVMSLEVAEHLSPQAAPVFIRSLCKLGNVILFSAAIPHQGGILHFNEQYPDYWIKLFAQNDFAPYDCIREKIWNNDNVNACYRQNILFFLKKSERDQYPQISCHNKAVLPLIHPEHYELKQRVIDDYKQIMKTPFHTGWFFMKKYTKAILRILGIRK